MKKMVSENVHDFMNQEEVDPELSAIEAVDDDEFSADEDGEEYIDYEIPTDEIIQTIRSEITIPEYSRKSLSIMLKNEPSLIDGVPMAELESGDFLFKIDGQIKKIKLNQILELDFTSDYEEDVNEGFGNGDEDEEYNFDDYMRDVTNYIKNEVPNWDILLGEESLDLIDWLEENQDLWDLQDLFTTGVIAEDAAVKIIEDFQEEGPYFNMNKEE